MSLDTVVEDIRDEGHERAAEIRADGEARAEEIEAEAEADAEEILAEARADVESEIEQLREQRLSSAKLEAKQTRLEARRDVLGEVRERVESELASMQGPTREALTRELIADAGTEFEESETVRVRGSPADSALIADVLSEFPGYEYAGEYDCLGGVVVDSEESRVRVNNTFDSVVEDVWEENLREISDRLFDQ